MLKSVSNRTPIAIGGARLQRLIVLPLFPSVGTFHLRPGFGERDGQSSSPARTVFIRDVTQYLKKMNGKKIILIHLGLFILLTTILLFTAEPILNLFATGFHSVEMWIGLILFGSLSLFILCATSCLIFIYTSRKRIDKVDSKN